MKELAHRKANRRTTHGLRQALWMAVLLTLPGGAQNGQGPSRNPFPQSAGQRGGPPLFDTGDDESTEVERRLRTLNADRQKSMIADTNKLLALTAELDKEIESAHPDSLTPDQLRKVAEIEKLARSVREKMSTSVRGVSPLVPPLVPMHR